MKKLMLRSRDAATGIVTYKSLPKDGKLIAPPSPVVTVQDELLNLAADFKTAVTTIATIGEKLEALARKSAQTAVAPAPG